MLSTDLYHVQLDMFLLVLRWEFTGCENMLCFNDLLLLKPLKHMYFKNVVIQVLGVGMVWLRLYCDKIGSGTSKHIWYISISKYGIDMDAFFIFIFIFLVLDAWY